MKPLTKKVNSYRITIENINSEDKHSSENMQFEMQDREDMFAVVDKLKQSKDLDEQSAIQVGVALRLLGSFIRQNRKNPLFIDFMPHFKNFMVNLKKTMKNS